jgi:hypothetical protein
MWKGIKATIFYLAVAGVVFVGYHVATNFKEISEAVRQFRERKPAFSGSAFDGWIRGRKG